MAFGMKRHVCCMYASVNIGGALMMIMMMGVMMIRPPYGSQTGIHAVFLTCHLLYTHRGVELIKKTESRIHT